MCQVWEGWNRAWIGKPLAGITYRVKVGATFKQHLNARENGELYISGHLAEGYYQNKELTAQKFVIVDGHRYFKTGDIVGEGKHGFFFIGRSDRQLKVNGILICPEELEACATNGDVYVAMHLGKLTAWTTKSISKFKEDLSHKFDALFHPKVFIQLKELPRNQNGKVDEKLLWQ